jgi:hypothetical protein
MDNPLGAGRRVLSVIAPHANSGKTVFVAHLARNIHGLGCLKISPAKDSRAFSEECEGRADQGFYLEGEEDLRCPDKDTSLYFQAGAAHVERLRCRRDCLEVGLREALQCFPAGMPLAVESSGAVKLLSPMAVVMVVRTPIREMKPSTGAIVSRVTDLVVNADVSEEQADREAKHLCEAYPTLQPGFIWPANLNSQPPPREMLTRLRRLLSA